MLWWIFLVSCAGLVSTWVLYPLVIALLTRRAARQQPDGPEDEPFVSVILATRESACAVAARIEDCLLAAYPADRLEVVVAVDARVDGVTADELCSLGAQVRVVRGDAPGGKAAALNAAVRGSRGDVLVFTDTHQRFRPDAIRELVTALRDPRTGAVSGRLELPGDCGTRSPVERYWAAERWLRSREAALHSPVGVTGAIWAMRRPLWTPLPPELILDDVYAPMCLVLRGHRVAFADRAIATDTRTCARAEEYRRKVRTLTGVVQLCAWMPGVLLPRRNPIWLQFVFHKLLRLLTPYWALGIVACAGVEVVRSVGPTLLLLMAVLGAGASSMLRWQARTTIVHTAREALLWAAVLLAAIAVATVNGMRARWDVWRA